MHAPLRLAGLLLALLLGPLAARADDGPAAFLPHRPGEWLVIGPVDHRARRPFNPDAVFARHLLDPAAPPPAAGQTLAGERGTPQAWRVQRVDAQGTIGGRIAWAYTAVDAPRDMIVMAWLRSGGTLFVNGTPHAGAIYGDRFEVPVRLRAGVNHVYVKGVRGAFQLTFSRPPADVFLAPFRQMTPDLAAGEPVDAVAGFLVVNASERALPQVTWTLAGNDWLLPAEARALTPVPPLGLVQVRVPLRTRPGRTAPGAPGSVDLALAVGGPAQTPATARVHVRPREKAVVRTFVSRIDDSVQRFGMRAPLHGGRGPQGLVLSLHGAGVQPRSQVNAYGPKQDFWIFAPTNRDRFGFDWQDWGRLDAYEVLAQGLRLSGVDRRRVYLTGHSMGGHGTWHLGANDPDGFAAIAPSAGWISFDTYPGPRRRGALTELWHAADGASLTRRLLDNLAQLPTFILHGTKDDNVPAAQAREMERLLTAAGAPPRVHYEEGRGHWWDGHPEPGAQCVDWPGIFDLFRSTQIAARPREIRFRTVDPSVDAQHHWVEVLQPLRYGVPCEVRASWDPRRRDLVLQTKNVRALRLAAGIEPARLNGRRVAIRLREGRVVLLRKSEASPWSDHLPSDWARQKKPARSGPFRRAWRDRFVFVYGTAGGPVMDRALLEQARYDAQRWMYRAHGQTLVVSDAAWLGARFPQARERRNAVLYGHRFSNLVLRRQGRRDPALPLRLAPVGVRLGEHVLAGPHQALCAVVPGRHPGRLHALVGSTSVRASRLGFTTMLFVSGAGWPDYVVYDEGVLSAGDGGVRAAGWFDAAWGLQPGGYLRPGAEPLSPR